MVLHIGIMGLRNGVKVNLYFPSELKEEVREIAKAEGMDMSALIREGTIDWIRRWRDRNALKWFTRKYCDNCPKNCEIGSREMLACMFKKLEG